MNSQDPSGLQNRIVYKWWSKWKKSEPANLDFFTLNLHCVRSCFRYTWPRIPKPDTSSLLEECLCTEDLMGNRNGTSKIALSSKRQRQNCDLWGNFRMSAQDSGVSRFRRLEMGVRAEIDHRTCELTWSGASLFGSAWLWPLQNCCRVSLLLLWIVGTKLDTSGVHLILESFHNLKLCHSWRMWTIDER